MPERRMKLSEAAKDLFGDQNDPRGTKLRRKLKSAEKQIKKYGYRTGIVETSEPKRVVLVHDNGVAGSGKREWVYESELRTYMKQDLKRTPSENMRALREAVREVLEDEAGQMFASWAQRLEGEVEALRNEVKTLSDAVLIILNEAAAAPVRNDTDPPGKPVKRRK